MIRNRGLLLRGAVRLANFVFAGGSDIFLAKYGSDGKLIWIVQIGGIWDDSGLDVAVGSAGNVYVTEGALDK
jgi:hypothetical protein